MMLDMGLYLRGGWTPNPNFLCQYSPPGGQQIYKNIEQNVSIPHHQEAKPLMVEASWVLHNPKTNKHMMLDLGLYLGGMDPQPNFLVSTAH